MRRDIVLLSFSFAASTFASQAATYARSLGLEKRQTCDIAGGVGACHQAAENCPWQFPGEVADWVLCYQDTPAEGGIYWCYNPAMGETCCSNDNIALLGETCDGPTQASGTWSATSTSPTYEASSMGGAPAPAPTYASYTTSDSYDEDYTTSTYTGGEATYTTNSSSPWSPGYTATGGNYRGTKETPGWRGDDGSTSFGGYAASSTIVAIGAGATAAPRFPLDAAGLALAAFGAVIV